MCSVVSVVSVGRVGSLKTTQKRTFFVMVFVGDTEEDHRTNRKGTARRAFTRLRNTGSSLEEQIECNTNSFVCNVLLPGRETLVAQLRSPRSSILL